MLTQLGNPLFCHFKNNIDCGFFSPSGRTHLYKKNKLSRFPGFYCQQFNDSEPCKLILKQSVLILHPHLTTPLLPSWDFCAINILILLSVLLSRFHSKRLNRIKPSQPLFMDTSDRALECQQEPPQNSVTGQCAHSSDQLMFKEKYRRTQLLHGVFHSTLSLQDAVREFLSQIV